MKAILFLVLVTAASLAAEPPLYKPDGAQAFDFWYAKSGETYHAFYLQRPDGSGHGSNTSVGSARSKDLVNWTEVGELLRADPNARWCNQRIATGFHRNTMLNEEGGIDPLEFRYYAMTDRVATTGKTWLGLTLQCAQCHTHKYDPIPQREYYQLMAFLDNADEPEIDLPDPAVAARRNELASRITRLVAALADKFPADTNCQPSLSSRENLETKFGEWLELERGRSVEIGRASCRERV